MTTITEVQEDLENKTRLLSSDEQAILSQIANKEPPYSQRAQALLAIDEGATQAEAGRQAGLTRAQVRYWLAIFRRDRTDMFPEELWNQALQVDADTPQSLAKESALPDVLDLEQAQDEEEVPQELPDAEETAGPVDAAAAQQEDMPEDKKKSKKKSKKQSKKAKKSAKTKKSKKDKKAKKEKKPAKKAKKNKSQKAKGKKGKSGKKKRKK